jgi:hypothetical protein
MKIKNHFGYNNVANDIYSGTAEFGKDYARIVAVFSFIIAIFMFILGIYLIRRDPTFPIAVQFTVKSVTPVIVTENVTENNVSVPKFVTTYNLIGTVPSCGSNNIILNGYKQSISQGTTITAYMHPNCAENIASETPDDTRAVGWVIIVICVLVIIFNILRLYFVDKYKGMAAAQGALGAGNIFRQLVR